MPAIRPVRIQTIKKDINGLNFANVISKTSDAIISRMNMNIMVQPLSKDRIKKQFIYEKQNPQNQLRFKPKGPLPNDV